MTKTPDLEPHLAGSGTRAWNDGKDHVVLPEVCMQCRQVECPGFRSNARPDWLPFSSVPTRFLQTRQGVPRVGCSAMSLLLEPLQESHEHSFPQDQANLRLHALDGTLPSTRAIPYSQRTGWRRNRFQDWACENLRWRE